MFAWLALLKRVHVETHECTGQHGSSYGVETGGGYIHTDHRAFVCA